MPSSTGRSQSTYDRTSIALHWIIGIGILVLAGLELFRHEFPKGHFIREGLKPIHQPAGVVLMVLIFVRAGWAQSFQRKPRSTVSKPGGTDAAEWAAKLVHLALYGLMIAIPVVGLASVVAAGKTIDFGLFTLAIPSAGWLFVLAKPLREFHEMIALFLLGLVFLHAAAALFHHYVIRDDVLGRMGASLARRSAQPVAVRSSSASRPAT